VGESGCAVQYRRRIVTRVKYNGNEARLKSDGRHRILHIGGSTADAGTIREALIGPEGNRYGVEWVGSLSGGLERLTMNAISAVLLDLRLPDCPGMDALKKLLQALPPPQFSS
jgi:CheY-like chemotaxis protein